MKTIAKPAPAARQAKSASPPAQAGDAPAPTQASLFEDAMRLFHARDFRSAKERFEQAANGESREMAHSARLHARMCEQRIARGQPQLNTPDDHYHYAVALINERKLAEAQRQLRQALDEQPKADYYHYAMALCLGLDGDFNQAARHLQTAIQLDPRNRSQARKDPDFQELSRHQAIRDILFGERKIAG